MDAVFGFRSSEAVGFGANGLRVVRLIRVECELHHASPIGFGSCLRWVGDCDAPFHRLSDMGLPAIGLAFPRVFVNMLFWDNSACG